MKSVVRFLFFTVALLGALTLRAQNKIDENRMERDIEVAENVLQTLMKQQMDRKYLFPVDVNGTYMPGYGVTFRIPSGGPMIYSIGSKNAVFVRPAVAGSGFYINSDHSEDNDLDVDIHINDDSKDSERDHERDRKGQKKRVNTDSAAASLAQKVIDAAKDFIADYGDVISQLSPDEKIVITNRMEGGNHFWYNNGNMRQKMIFVEATKGDITQFKQGKLNRAQLIAKINVVNSETTDELDPDLELLSTIINRLYRSDLSKTYYIQETPYYERLKDYGVIYYLQVYSSNESDYQKFDLPTVGLDNVDKATRDKKVIELYPAFEKDVKESMLDYGKTLKSLKDNEQLIFNIKLTKCKGCGIPSTLELSTKDTVLKDYSSGKISKEAAMLQIAVKKGSAQ